MDSAVTLDPRRWKALAVLGIAYLMVVLDVSIVNVALPSIQTDLDFSPEDLQWVVSGYALTFGGLLLLGGRSGDILGRRRIFMIGLALFSAFSLLCAVSQTDTMLIVARLLQGAAAALLAPSVFSIVTVTFREGADRNKALGILGAIAGSGAAIGVLAGGFLTEYFGWEWVFWVNVPIGLVTLLFVPRFVQESKVEGLARRFDALGAVTVTGSLMLLVFGLTRANQVGWTSPETIGVLVASAVLMVVFLITEHRSRYALVPLSVLQAPYADGGEHRGLRARHGRLRNVLPAVALPAAGAGLLRRRDRRGLSGGRAHGHRGVRRGAGPGDQDRGQAVPRVRDAVHPRGPAVVHPDLDRRHLLRRPVRRVHARGHRPRLLVRAGLDRGPGRHPAARGRARVGPDQHQPADRRRARRRHPHDGRDHPHRHPSRRGRLPAVGAHRRLRPGLLGGGGVRGGGGHRDLRHPEERGPGRHRGPTESAAVVG